MAWHLDQPSWEPDQIYVNPLADASGLIPPFLAGVEPAVATDYGTYLNPSTNDVHHLAHGHRSYRGMSVSVPPQWAAITGSNIPTPITGTMNDPRAAINQPPIVPASSHPEPKARTRKKTSIRVTDPITYPRPATTFKCKWEGCNYSGSFSREHELLRHLRTKHIAPLTHPCPVQGCDKVCNREDNLLQHMQKRHGSC